MSSCCSEVLGLAGAREEERLRKEKETEKGEREEKRTEERGGEERRDRNASKGRHKLGLRIGQPGDQQARPRPTPSPSGAHTQEAAGYRPALTAAHIHNPRPAASLPPSSPLPAVASAVRLPGSPERGAHGHQHPNCHRRPSQHPEYAAGGPPGSHRGSPDTTRRHQ